MGVCFVKARLEKVERWKDRVRGWSVVIPDPAEIAARAQRLYWASLTPEQREAELTAERMEGRHCLPLKSAAEVARIVARQKRLLGTKARGGLKVKVGESSVDFVDRVRAQIARRQCAV